MKKKFLLGVLLSCASCFAQVNITGSASGGSVKIGVPGSPIVSGVLSINGVGGAYTFSGSGVSCTATTCIFTGATAALTSINSQTGPAILIHSSNASVNITTTTNDIDLTVGGSSGPPTILPAGSSIITIDDSRSFIDNASNSAIAVSAYSSTGTACTLTTATQAYTSGTWVQLFGTGWPAGWLTTNNEQIYHLTSATPTSVTFPCGQAAGSGSLSGPDLADVTNTWPIQLSLASSVAGHATLVSQVNYVSSSNTTLDEIKTDITNGVYPTCTSSACYAIMIPTLYDFWQVCAGSETIATYEGNLKSIWASFHGLGYKFIQTNQFPDIGVTVPACSAAQQASLAYTLNLWIQGNNSTTVIQSSPSSVQYYDAFVDAESTYTDAATQTVLQNSIAHHFSDALHAKIASQMAQYFATGADNWKRNNCGPIDNCGALTDTNVWTGSNINLGTGQNKSINSNFSSAPTWSGISEWKGFDSAGNAAENYVNSAFSLTAIGQVGANYFSKFTTEARKVFSGGTTFGRMNNPATSFCWSPTQTQSGTTVNLTDCDVGFSRDAAGVVKINLGVDYTSSAGSLRLTGIFGPTTAPSGSCTSAQGGQFRLTGDGAITWCPIGGGTWTTFSAGSGLSGMTAGQIPVAATATTAASSKPQAGSGAGIVTGPTSSTSGDLPIYTGTGGQQQDSGILLSAIPAANIASGALVNGMAATTQTGGDNTTKLATTAFVQAAIAAAGTGAGIVTYSGPSLTFSGTQYFPIGGGASSSTTETNVDIDAPAAVTIQNMTVQMSAAPGVGNSVIYTWRKNAADTALTCTISGASATSCADTTHNFSTAALDLLSISAVTTGTIVGTPTVVMGAQVGVAAAATGVTSVSNSDGSLSVSPTTGAVVESLNTAHANTWTAAQTIGSGGSIGVSGTGTNNATSIDGVAVTGTPTSGMVPTATSGTAATWQSPAVGAVTNLCSVVTLTNATCTSGQIVITNGSSSVTVSAIPGTYSNLRFVINSQTNNGTAQFMGIQFNTDAAANYDYAIIYNSLATTTTSASGAAVSTTAICAMATSSATNRVGSCEVNIPLYATTTFFKEAIGNGGYWNNTFLSRINATVDWKNTAAITEFKLIPGAGTFVTGSTIVLFGEL